MSEKNSGSGLDFWDKEVADKYPEIEFDDEVIYEKSSEIRWLYDKLLISQKYSNYPGVPLEAATKFTFPFVLRPKINLLGMGQGTYIFRSPREWAEFRSKIKLPSGYFIQEYINKPQYSIDVVVSEDGTYQAFGMEAHTNAEGSFQAFIQSLSPAIYLGHFARKLIEALPPGYYCIEARGGNVIEAHARPSMQFWDLSPIPPYNNAREGRYMSVVFRASKNFKVTLEENRIYSINERLPYEGGEVTSVTFHFRDGEHLGNYAQDEMSYRYLTINGCSFPSIMRLHTLILTKTKFTI